MCCSTNRWGRAPGVSAPPRECCIRPGIRLSAVAGMTLPSWNDLGGLRLARRVRRDALEIVPQDKPRCALLLSCKLELRVSGVPDRGGHAFVPHDGGLVADRQIATDAFIRP